MEVAGAMGDAAFAMGAAISPWTIDKTICGESGCRESVSIRR
jgi:hypothetical protein